MDEEKELITPETGLTAQQVQEHLEAGLGAGLPADSGRSEKEIILRHSLTFFNLVFIVLAVLLIVVFGIWGPGYDAQAFIYFQF